MSGERLHTAHKQKDVRESNIIAAKAVAEAVRTSLGPRGMDKMIQDGKGEVVISNDGATILTKMNVFHPCAKMLVDISKSQDIVAGDGTTSVVVIAGELLNACSSLLSKGIHPTTIAESFKRANAKAAEILEGMSTPINCADKEMMVKAVSTSLSSKVISQNTAVISPLCVEAIHAVAGPNFDNDVDLSDIKIVKQLGGTIDDTELVQGMVFEKGCVKSAGGPTVVKNAKIALIQFCLSAPKTDMENSVVVTDYAAMDRLLREERKYILKLCKAIKKAGVNVLLIQKSILREAVNDLSLHFLAKMGIMVIRDIERTDVEFICRTCGCQPIAHVDALKEDKLGGAAVCEEVSAGGKARVVKITGITNPGKSITVLLRGSNSLVLEEVDRSVHDALCVLRSLVKKKFLIAGGGAPETEIAMKLGEWSRTLSGMESYCVKAFAEALEVIPYTLAENAGLNPIEIVTQLRKEHKEGCRTAGINVRKMCVADMNAENVLQPLIVSTSALGLATECIGMILKIDDIVMVR